MSIYRFARTTALLSLASRYRVKIWRITFALAFAATTAWLYTDVAAFVAAQYPQFAWLALIAKTAIVYAALVYCFWQFRTPVEAMPEGGPDPDFSRLESFEAKQLRSDEPDNGIKDSALERLANKPELRSRRDDILSPKD